MSRQIVVIAESLHNLPSQHRPTRPRAAQQQHEEEQRSVHSQPLATPQLVVSTSKATTLRLMAERNGSLHAYTRQPRCHRYPAQLRPRSESLSQWHNVPLVC
eukprot:1157216-Pelagomonas_calceolata.AAC.12